MIGCLFQWKQVIRRKLIDVRIPAKQIKAAMMPGVIDVLTVVPIEDIRKKDFIGHVIDNVSRPTE